MLSEFTQNRNVDGKDPVPFSFDLRNLRNPRFTSYLLLLG